ncbi:toll/interleukin-1 receptor domain-containing protein [Reyranella sp.]|uniref:toll/interleukin-1 receptor domain-containing protein n=1 Tax=Reyranella sp. TaxID=1929291 RepID=UPI0037839EF1
MVHQQAGDPTFHDAFISYSRKDRPFAVLLQRALNGYTPPSGLPVARRRLNVFRDEEDFTGTEYFQAVRHHLAGSRKLIVLCSPNARASKFVDDEIRSFARTHAAGDLIPVLIAGRPETSGSPDDSQFAFPAALCEILELPLAADYRDFDPKASKLDSPPCRTAWFKLLADLCNCSRAEIEMREHRRKVRQRLQWGAGVTAISVALAVAAFVANNASRLAESNDLASQALGIASSDPDRGTALALDAIGKRRTPLAVSALRAAQASLPELQASVAPEGGPNDPMVFSPDGQRLVVADGEAGARVLDARTGKPLLQLATEGKPTGGIQFSSDGRLVALADFEEGTSVHDIATGKRLATVKGTLSWLASSADGAPRALVVREGRARLVALQPDGSERVLQGIALPDLSEASWAVSPDGRRLAVATEGGGKGRLALIDLASGKVQTQTGAFSTAGVAWSPKGTWLVSKWLMGFAVLDTRERTRPFLHDTGDEISVEDVAFSTDETLLATTDRGGLTTLWDVKQGKVAGKFQGPGARAYTPDFSADGALLSVVFSNGQASLFGLDARNKELIQDPLVTLEGTWGELVAARFSPSGRELIARYAGGKLVAWSIERWLPRHRLPLRYEARFQAGQAQGLADLELAPDGSVIATKQGGRWRGWNTASGAEVSDRPKDMAPLAQAARLESDGRSLRLAGQQVLLQTPRTGSVLRLAHSDAVTSASFNPTGACVVSTSGVVMASGGTPPGGNRVRLWDSETGALLRDWGLAAPPDAAFFAGPERVVVLYSGQALIYPVPLCGSEDGLLRRAAATRPSAD